MTEQLNEKRTTSHEGLFSAYFIHLLEGTGDAQNQEPSYIELFELVRKELSADTPKRIIAEVVAKQLGYTITRDKRGGFWVELPEVNVYYPPAEAEDI